MGNIFSYLSSVRTGMGNAIPTPSPPVEIPILEQPRKIAKGEYTIPSIEKRKLGTIVFVAVDLPLAKISSLLEKLSVKNAEVEAFLKDKQMETSLRKAHVTLAHKRSHGVTAVASYGIYLHREVRVGLTAFLFNDKLAALEARLGYIDDEMMVSKNQWPHVTIWTGKGVAPKEANTLPQLHSKGKATRVEINPPITISGTLELH